MDLDGLLVGFGGCLDHVVVWFGIFWFGFVHIG